MVFCPAAKCKTVVPDTFSVLLSQRRRWIGSSIHNLFELVQVPNLCGVFCFSYQFLVIVELFGTLTLPIGICLTYALAVNLLLIPPTTFQECIPVILLGSVLALPTLLIVATARKPSYVVWMLIYIAALPIWNFVLPLYALWHLDDLSWGDTRRVEGETATRQKIYSEDKTAVFDGTCVPLRHWADWEKSRLRNLRRSEQRKKELERAQQVKRGQRSLWMHGDVQSITSRESGDKWGADIGAVSAKTNGGGLKLTFWAAVRRVCSAISSPADCVASGHRLIARRNTRRDLGWKRLGSDVVSWILGVVVVR
jgi:chitin synthase